MRRLIAMVFIVSMLSGASWGAILVDTNFNPDSAGVGSWSGGDWNGNVDIASGVAWYSNYTSNDAHKANYAPITAIPTDRRIGYIKGKPGAKSYSSLVIGSGQNTGVYKATWVEAVNDRSSSQPNKVGHTAFSAVGGLTAVEVKMDDTNHNIYVSSAAGDVLLTSLTNDLWYEFELTMDFSTGKFNISVKEEGASSWAATQNSLDFVSSEAVSLDRIELSVDSHDSAYGYQFINGYDDLKVESVPEPATLLLFGLGSLISFKRRKK